MAAQVSIQFVGVAEQRDRTLVISGDDVGSFSDSEIRQLASVLTGADCITNWVGDDASVNDIQVMGLSRTISAT